MAYKRRQASSSYQMRSRIISMSTHMNFRVSFEQGLQKAMAEASQLQKEGWKVDVVKGVLTESQAKRYAEMLKDQAQTKFIPVAKWMNEDTYLIAYKPKPKTEAQPQSAPDQTVTSDEILQNFIQIARKRDAPSPENLKEGFIMDDLRVIGLARAGTQGASSLVAELEPHFLAEVKVKELLAGLRRASGPKYRKEFVKFGATHVSIGYAKTVLKIIGKGKVKIHSKESGKPLMLTAESGDKLFIAPAVVDSILPAQVVDYQDALILGK